MKKLSVAVAVAAALSAGVASAYTMGQASPGALVPNVIHNNAADTTGVAIVNNGTDPVLVYWTFFNTNSEHKADGEIGITPQGTETLIWSDPKVSGGGFAGQRGYFVLYAVPATPDASKESRFRPTDPTLTHSGEDTGLLISAEAFQADAANGDAVYIPVFPIGADDIVPGAVYNYLDGSSLRGLWAGAQAGDWPVALPAPKGDTQRVTAARFGNAVLDMRFQDGGDFKSNIVLWATGGLSGTSTVQVYRTDQARQSLNFNCAANADELCFVKAGDLEGLRADFTGGIIRYTYRGVPRVEDGRTVYDHGSVISYTEVASKQFNAVQTILNGHTGSQTAWIVDQTTGILADPYGGCKAPNANANIFDCKDGVAQAFLGNAWAWTDTSTGVQRPQPKY